MLAFSLHFSAPLLVLCPSLFLVHSLSGLLPLSCGLSSHVPSLFPAPSWHMLAVSPAAMLPHSMGFIPSFCFPFLWPPFPTLSLSCLLSCPCPPFVTPLLISLHLIFLVPSLSHAFTLSHSPALQLHLLFPMCLLSTSHTPLLPPALTPFPFPYVHSSSGKLYFSSKISVSCSLSCPLPLSFTAPFTFTHSVSLSCYLISFFLFSSCSLFCVLALPCALTFSCVLPHSSRAFPCAPRACILFLMPS